MRVSTAYFVGAGTVVVAIAAGLGGGLLLGNIMSPQQPKHPSSEVARLEQRAAPQPIPAMAGASQPVPYTAAPQIANTVSEQASQRPQQAAPQQAQPQAQEASTKSAESPKPQPERSAAVQPAAAQPPANAQQTAAPEDSYAKARDADVKREVRRAEDKRKAERRQQWADKRRGRERQGDDLDSVEASVREATEARPVFSREQRYERREPGFGMGRINLFDD
jgi:hypothetical protein